MNSGTCGYAIKRESTSRAPQCSVSEGSSAESGATSLSLSVFTENQQVILVKTYQKHTALLLEENFSKYFPIIQVLWSHPKQKKKYMETFKHTVKTLTFFQNSPNSLLIQQSEETLVIKYPGVSQEEAL